MLRHLFSRVGSFTLPFLFRNISDYCALHTRTEKIRTKDNNGNKCVSTEEITFNYCQGRCMNNKMIPILYANVNEANPAMLSDKDCRCCTGWYMVFNAENSWNKN